MSDRFTFDCSPAELLLLVALVTEGAVPFDAQAEALIAASGQSLEALAEGLEERGVLLRIPFEESVGVVSEVAAMLRTTLDPERLLIARLTEQTTERQMTFSAVEGHWVSNQFDGTTHHFADLGDVATVISHLLATLPEISGTASAESASLETLLERAKALALLLRVTTPTEDTQAEQAMGWLVADGQLWLLERGQDDMPQPATLDQLRIHLATFIASQD